MTSCPRRPGGDSLPAQLRPQGGRGRPEGRRDEAGVALALAVGVMFLVVILGLTAVSQTTTAIFQSGNAYTQVRKSLGNETPQLFLNGSTSSLGGATSAVCASAGVGSPAAAYTTNIAQCPTGVSPSGAATGLASGMATTASASATTTFTTGAASASAATMSLGACGLAQIQDTAGTDAALLYGGATYGTPFAPLNSSGMTFNGTDAWGETVNKIVGPNTFTVTAWFKTPTSGTQSGSIIGFSNVQGLTGQSNWDRMLWIDPGGHVRFGANPPSSGLSYVTSPGSYNDGNWHFAAVTVSSAGAVLYVDGANVATSASMTGGETYSGWWHLGWSNANNGWSDPPTSAYFPGSLAEVAEFPSALSAAAVGALYAASGVAVGVPYVASTPTNFTNPVRYTSLQSADGAGDVWAMSENGGTPYTSQAPGVASLLDVTGNANNAAPEGGVTLGAGGPFVTGSLGVSLTGATGSFAQTSISAPTLFPLTEMAWFKTTTNGSLIGSSSTQNDGSAGNYDRMIYVDNAGHLVYGVYNGSTTEVTSPGTYVDNKWHLAVASAGPAGDLLYVDGALVASNPNATTSNDRGSEYWHIGFAYMNSWPDNPADPYFTGSLAQEAVFPAQLTAAQVSSLYSASAQASDASMSSQVMSLSPSYYWPLDQVTPCSSVEITLQGSLNGSAAACLLPASGTCALSSAVTFDSLPWSYQYPPGTLSTAAVTVAVALTGAPPGGSVGLHVISTFAIVGTAVGDGGATVTAKLVYGQTDVEL